LGVLVILSWIVVYVGANVGVNVGVNVGANVGANEFSIIGADIVIVATKAAIVEVEFSANDAATK
jgi:hypothetical protein